MEGKVIEVSTSLDIVVARERTKALAKELGFDNARAEETAIAVSELASNLVKHAGRGRLTLSPIWEKNRSGIQIESLDSGPGIADIEQAITDGFSTVGSWGLGLGAVNRLMDDFRITSPISTGGGTHIVCKRWIRVEAHPASCPLDFGAATRPHPFETVNGDAFILERGCGQALVGVVDALGHGPPAHHAAQRATLYVKNHAWEPLERIFRGADLACRGTHGAVMALVRFDWMRWRLTYASLGNIECRVFGSGEPLNFVVRRGVIGLQRTDPVISEHAWKPAATMVVHSDGVQSHWRWEDFPGLEDMRASTAAHQLLSRLARDDDDATVLVVKRAAEGRVGVDW